MKPSQWAKKEGHHPLVARVRHVNDEKKPSLAIGISGLKTG
jgi:hypothetical protein